jgi:hypothetical protein
LIDAGNANQLAATVSAVIDEPLRRAEAQSINQVIVDRRAARLVVTESVEAFYETVIGDVI